ncbi:MAG: hypothetical protein AUK34_06145 [Ignavibacteria bacterium CG2_30_36_16]|nr:hypothetical protein [Ignavibacteria bacterium]OIP60745.1 MAG: hypothetical protein AUK34_06145 [Ignavibacteria bacterium CG2_30_36_16]PJB00321.1 MAG: hypothetical protein CO127_08620 [Ignavibacteria bacterium CG_4_9_14_3_um_filter_36_18]
MNIFAALNFLKSYKGFSVLLTVLFITASINFLGCDAKENKEPSDAQLKLDSIVAVEAQRVADSIAQQVADSIALAEKKAMIPDMIGKWTGSLDGRATTLTITSQTENTFSGTIVINYRQVSRKAVAGAINVENNKVSMRDTEKFRYAGTYSGTLSEDHLKFSGSHTITADNKSFSFSLTKK